MSFFIGAFVFGINRSFIARFFRYLIGHLVIMNSLQLINLRFVPKIQCQVVRKNESIDTLFKIIFTFK